MKVLITGASGFVGRHFHKALRPSHDVLALDVEGDDHDVLNCDARDFFAESDDRYFDLVIHAAAHVGGRADIEGRPAFIGAYNLQLDGALFEWALKARPGRIVYLSSSAVYPLFHQEETGPRLPLREQLVQPTRYATLPDATYGWVKLTGERLAEEAYVEGLNVTVVRPFSGYGEDQSLDYPFPSFADRTLRGENPFTIWGSGRQVRDWIHIDDVVNATLALVENDVNGPVNLCTGRGVTFDELASLFLDSAHRVAALEHQTDAPEGVMFRVGDPTLLHRYYTPKITLEEGIARALDA